MAEGGLSGKSMPEQQAHLLLALPINSRPSQGLWHLHTTQKFYTAYIRHCLLTFLQGQSQGYLLLEGQGYLLLELLPSAASATNGPSHSGIAAHRDSKSTEVDPALSLHTPATAA